MEEVLYPSQECKKENMSYSNDIVPILSDNCYVCHDKNVRFGGIVVDNYQDLILNADNGVLIGAISHSAGYSPMPQNSPQLLDCEIQKIEMWIMEGAKNN